MPSVIRSDNFELIKRYNDDCIELYDMESEISEKLNLAAKLPDVANKIKRELEAWLKESGAIFPTPSSK